MSGTKSKQRQRNRVQAPHLQPQPQPYPTVNTTAPLAVASVIGWTLDELQWRWKSHAAAHPALRVTPFYSDRDPSIACFSNFWRFPHPIPFSVPDSCWGAGLDAAGLPRTVMVEFSEKSIMLCKAARFNDHMAYRAIAACDHPRDAKRLGRTVTPDGDKANLWSNARWHAVVLDVAISVVHQKFGQMPAAAKILRSTGQSIIAESTRADAFWGTGVGLNAASAHVPKLWQGCNILGYALMVARERVRPGAGHNAFPAPAPAR